MSSITSENKSVHSLSSYPDKIFATIGVNDKRNLKIKIDTDADTNILTTDDLQKL